MKKTCLFAVVTLFTFVLKAQTTMEISSATQLIAFANAVNDGYNFSGSTITLTTDIVLSEQDTLMPIGTTEYKFEGTFNGQGYHITNLQIRADAVETGFVCGLFGCVGENGIVKDLIVDNLSVLIEDIGNYSMATCQIGAIAGRNEGSIAGCANRGVTVYGNWDNADVGGIVGYNKGVVQNCYNLGRIHTGNNYANNHLGGIAGINTENGNVLNCFVRAEVAQDVSGSSRSGPICGNNLGNVSSCFYMDATPSDATLILENSADNSSAIDNADSKTHQNVLLADRTVFSDEAWNTLCLPFDLIGYGNGRSPIAGATVRELDFATSGFNASTGVLTLNFRNVTNIIAGRPYIVKWDEGIREDLSNPLFLDVTVADKTESERTVTTADGNVNFIGIFSPLYIPTEDKSILYLGDQNLLYYPNSAMQIGSCRAYFRLNGIEQGAMAIRKVDMNFGTGAQQTTTIHQTALSTPKVSKNSIIYNINGQRINSNPVTRGIYIIGNKKIFKK